MKVNMMKNTKASTSECIKADVLHKKILWRLNVLERQISECKKGFTRFYAQVQKKTNVLVWKKNENDIPWVEAFDEFAENWEEMENVKDEVDWMIRDIFFAVEREEEEQRENMKRHMMRGDELGKIT